MLLLFLRCYVIHVIHIYVYIIHYIYIIYVIHNISKGLLKLTQNKFRPQFNGMIKSLQFHKLSRQSGENADEWIGRLRLEAIECNYKEIDGQLKEQFIHSLNDTDMLAEINVDLTKREEYTEVTSENVVCWAKREDAQRSESAIMNSLTETKEI